MTSRDQVGSDVADKLSSIRLPTLPQQDGAGYRAASDHSPAALGHTSHSSCLPDKSGGGEPELFTTASDTSSLVAPVCPQEKTAGLRNLGSHTAGIQKPTRDLCGFPGGAGASLLQSPAVPSETLLMDLETPQQEQKTSQYSTNSNDSSIKKPFSDVQGLPKENDLPENLAGACGLSLELPGPSANDIQGVVKPDIDELDFQGNSAVANKLSLVRSAKSSPERLEDSQKKTSDTFAAAADYISEDNLSIGGKVTLQEDSEADRKTPSVDIPRTLQKEQGSTENTVDHHDAVGAPIPCHTHEQSSLSSASCVNLLGPAEGSLSAVLHNAQRMSKLESSERKDYHDSAPTASCTSEASLPIRADVSFPENSEVNSNTPSAEIPSTVETGLRGTNRTVDGHVEAGGPCNTNRVPSLSSTSEDSVLDDDEDSMSAIMRIADAMYKLPTGSPCPVTSTIGNFQQIFISPSTTAAKKTADVRGTAIMPAHSGDGSGRGTELAEIPFMHYSSSGETTWGGSSYHVVPTASAVPLAGVSSGAASQAGLVSSSAVHEHAVALTAERSVAGAKKVEHIVVTLPSRSAVPGESSQAIETINTRAEGLKRPHSSAGSENEGLSDFPSRLGSHKKLAVIKKLCPEDLSTHVGRTSRKTKGGAQASQSAGKGQQAAMQSRQPAAPRTGRKQVSGGQRKGKLLSKHPEHMVPNVLHPVPSPLSSKSSCESSKLNNDGSSGPSDTKSAPYLSAKLRSMRCSTGQSSSTPASNRASSMETTRNRTQKKCSLCK
ncbi:uncharacterized protein LOC144113466 [Amblyomma americanum]